MRGGIARGGGGGGQMGLAGVLGMAVTVIFQVPGGGRGVQGGVQGGGRGPRTSNISHDLIGRLLAEHFTQIRYINVPQDQCILREPAMRCGDIQAAVVLLLFYGHSIKPPISEENLFRLTEN